MSERILRLPEVLARTGLSRTTVHVLGKAGNFPASIGVGSEYRRGWLESEVDAWVAEQVQNSRGRHVAEGQRVASQ